MRSGREHPPKEVGQIQLVGAHPFTVGVSIGLVIINNSFKRIAQVMNAADTACYAAKDAGRGRLYVYQEDAALASGVMARWSGSHAPSARYREPSLLDVQKILPLTPGNDTPHFELLVRMRDESGRSVHAGRIPAGGERYNLRYATTAGCNAAIQWTRKHPDAVPPVRGCSSTCRATRWSISRPLHTCSRRSRRQESIRGASDSRWRRESPSATVAREPVISELRRQGCTFAWTTSAAACPRSLISRR